MGAALQKSLAERKKHEVPMRPRWERKAFLREARDAIVVSPLPDSYQDFIGSWMDKPKKILNDEGIEEDELTPGALFDVKDKPWFIEKSKQTGLGAGRTPCKEKKFRSGHTFVIPAGYTADEDFRGCMKSIKIGLKDDRMSGCTWEATLKWQSRQMADFRLRPWRSSKAHFHLAGAK